MMTYEESAALMTDAQFRGRIKVACLKYAGSILDEPATTAGHTSRIRWAGHCVLQPDMTASQVQPPTVMDPEVQADGPGITDVALQGAVETTVNKML